jgi:hypothetical protein
MQHLITYRTSLFNLFSQLLGTITLCNMFKTIADNSFLCIEYIFIRDLFG